MKYTYKHTVYASYIGYITQAIINNLSPLLFVTFQREFQVSLEQLALLISLNFGAQILVDILAIKFVDKIGYRTSAVISHIAAALGLICLGVLPNILPSPYVGLIIAVILNSIGGGIIEVIISPIVESLPGDEKASAMSLLHSFYCWGFVLVVVLSTLYFSIIGLEYWYYLPLLWALVPLFNTFFFIKVPLRVLVEEHERMPLRKLFSTRIFWVLFLLMVSAGAAEQAMTQWSSLFAELGLGVSKTMGDLLGPCAFAILMGLSRTYFGTRGSKLKLRKALILSSILCVASYLLVVFSPIPLLSLIGCSLVGLSVGIFWPGTLSLSMRTYPSGGTAMFAVLALAGDLGCSLGPGLVGIISSRVQDKGGIGFLSSLISGADLTQIGLKTGLLMAIIFPIVMILGVAILRNNQNKKNI